MLKKSALFAALLLGAFFAMNSSNDAKACYGYGYGGYGYGYGVYYQPCYRPYYRPYYNYYSPYRYNGFGYGCY